MNIAYVDMRWHTAGFVCLQIGMFSVTFQNCLHILQTGTAYNLFWDTCGGPEKRRRNTKLVTIYYLIFQVTLTVLKLGYTGSVVATGIIPEFYFAEVLPGWNAIDVCDKGGMLMNAVLPLYIAWRRSQMEYPLEIKIGQRVLYDEEDEETVPLK